MTPRERELAAIAEFVASGRVKYLPPVDSEEATRRQLAAFHAERLQFRNATAAYHRKRRAPRKR